MEISKSDTLLLYSVLFRTVVSDSVTLGDKEDHAADLLCRFETYLTDLEPQDSVQMRSASDNEIIIEADAVILPDVLPELPAVSVKTPSGEYMSLEFEPNIDTINATFNDDEVVLEDVLAVKVLHDDDACEIQLHAGDEWHVFPVKKLPKIWKSTFNSGDIYAVISKEEEE